MLGLLGCLGVALAVAPPAFAASPPRTGFEKRQGASWTTQPEELAFLRAVDDGSRRASVSVIGYSAQRRPLHLVQLGYPTPRPIGSARSRPTLLVTCTQHGNEPAPREGCLQRLRDLAFSTDRVVVDLLRRWTVLVVPTVNPDGVAADARQNGRGIDINRDHLNLVSHEGRVIGRLIRDWRPDVLVDLHEYGPGIPVLYDDDVLYLWPRNLNVDAQVYGLSKTLAIDYIGKGAEAAGFTSDEYGQAAVGDQDVAQTAGDADEGILRNAAGLRHVIGILVESRVDMRRSPEELASSAAVRMRRVASQKQALADTFRFMREQESIVELATEGAPVRKTKEGRDRSAPVYFGGADNDTPEPSEIQDPPPCGYLLTAQQAKKVGRAFEIHGIRAERRAGRLLAILAQPAEPLIPLLVDGRGTRAGVAGSSLDRC